MSGPLNIHIRPRFSRCPCGERYIKVPWPTKYYEQVVKKMYETDFQYGNKKGVWYICENCDNSYPSSFYLEFWWGSKQRFVYSDERGRVLDTLRRAKQLKEDILFEILNASFNIKKYTNVRIVRVAGLLDTFFREKTREIAPSYVSGYKTMVNAAKSFFGGKNVREVTRADLISYKDHLSRTNTNIGPTTLKNYLALFRVFLNWCKERDLLTVVPPLPKIDCPEPKVAWISQEDQMKILEHVREPDKPLISFLMLHGTRPSEARALKCKDVNLGNGTINVHATFSVGIYRDRRKGRGSRPYDVPIHPECLSYITERVKLSLPEAWLFPNPVTGDAYSVRRWNKTWSLVKKELNIKGITPYQMTRHSFASQLGAAEVPVNVIKNLLGHTEISTSMKYTHPDLKLMRTSIEKLSLKGKGQVVQFPQSKEG
ncbi:MAG: site-specific integrase [Pseudomonadota bacterium]